MEVKDLTFAYDQKNVLDNVSFSVESGEVIGILGPNGAGKTTTIRLITGVLPLKAHNGSIHVHGHAVATNPRLCKSFFGILPETSHAFLDFTVWENIMFSGEVYGLSKDKVKAKASDLLDAFGLTEKKNAKTKSLSKGLKQRMNFCLALLHDPSILIFDEPTSGLDPISMNMVRQRILGLKGEGKTILLTTHDLMEAEKLCDRVIIMNKGRVIAFKSPADLKHEFKTPTQIVFKTNKPVDRDLLEKMKEVLAVKQMAEDMFMLTSTSPFKDIAGLYKLFVESGIETELVKVKDTSLEEVFVEIITTANKDQ